MKTKLLIEVDCEPVTCGECVHVERHTYCQEFKRELRYDIAKMQSERIPECVAAEKAAKGTP